MRVSNYWKNGVDGKPLPYLDGVKIIVNGDTTIRPRAAPVRRSAEASDSDPDRRTAARVRAPVRR